VSASDHGGFSSARKDDLEHGISPNKRFYLSMAATFVVPTTWHTSYTFS
jgi:hypothetical protein